MSAAPESACVSVGAVTAASVLLPGFVGTTLPGWLEGRLRGGLAGVCLFGENVESLEQVRALTASILAVNPRAIIAIDEEGGDVTRLHYAHGSPYPGNAILGRLDDTELTRRVAEHVGESLHGVGVGLTLAPVVDVNSNPDNPVIGVRSFGADPDLVARHSHAWIRGVESRGVASSPKHFPGHGDTSTDSHLALPVVPKSLEELRAKELVPFHAAALAGASTIMTSHVLLPALDASAPATLSPRVLGDVLRGELGYEGVIVSDALDMHGASGELGIPAAAVGALAAGCDVLCIGTRNTDEQLAEIEAAIDAAIAEGVLTPERIQDASARVAALGTRIAARLATHVPGSSSREFFMELGRVARAFDVRPGASLTGPHHLVGLETSANIAVGVVPWAGFVTEWVGEGDPLPAAPAGARLVLVGRDNHRHPWVRELVSRTRETHPETLVVDMGWPSENRAFADVATFGASRLIGDALLWLLGVGDE